jgi:hypothetical protein
MEKSQQVPMMAQIYSEAAMSGSGWEKTSKIRAELPWISSTAL